jgi:hypothetical protein
MAISHAARTLLCKRCRNDKRIASRLQSTKKQSKIVGWTIRLRRFISL